jgi:hypothetical protein
MVTIEYSASSDITSKPISSLFLKRALKVGGPVVLAVIAIFIYKLLYRGTAPSQHTRLKQKMCESIGKLSNSMLLVRTLFERLVGKSNARIEAEVAERAAKIKKQVSAERAKSRLRYAKWKGERISSDHLIEYSTGNHDMFGYEDLDQNGLDENPLNGAMFFVDLIENEYNDFRATLFVSDEELDTAIDILFVQYAKGAAEMARVFSNGGWYLNGIDAEDALGDRFAFAATTPVYHLMESFAAYGWEHLSDTYDSYEELHSAFAPYRLNADEIFEAFLDFTHRTDSSRSNIEETDFSRRMHDYFQGFYEHVDSSTVGGPSLRFDPTMLAAKRALHFEPNEILTEQLVIKRYRVLIRKVHPDLNSDVTAHDSTVVLNRSYQYLLDHLTK